MGAIDTPLLSIIDQKTRLAGSNRMELLLFSLGGRERHGINVFKVREVCDTPDVTRTPNMPNGVEGIISLRGSIIPVINLARFTHTEPAPGNAPSKLIITEFNCHTQAFRVADVDRIIRVDWQHVKAPNALAEGPNSLVTAIVELDDGKLVSILDVEQILNLTFGDEPLVELDRIDEALVRPVLFADDSVFARKKIVQTLEQLGLPYMQSVNGKEAWSRLDVLALQAASSGRPLRELVGLVLVDAEMPEMDGYVLTQTIKADARFTGIPVVMHSSLSSVANRKMGQHVGVDAYVAKFNTGELALTLAAMLRK
jgi:two-component system chemotaxis response regulator CheV